MKIKQACAFLNKSKGILLGICLIAAVLTLTICGYFYLPHDPEKINIAQKLQFFSAVHPLGTDHLGRDILSRLMLGTRVTFSIALQVVSIGLLVGVTLGSLAGYIGKWVDAVISKFIHVLMSFPGVLIALMTITVFGTQIWNIVLALSLMAIPRFAKIARASCIQLKNAEFVKATQARGASHFRILVLHILPNLSSELMVTASLSFASTVMSEAGLSYLGLSASSDLPSLGRMLSEAQDVILQAPWYVFVPAVTITILVLGFNLIADSLQNTQR